MLVFSHKIKFLVIVASEETDEDSFDQGDQSLSLLDVQLVSFLVSGRYGGIAKVGGNRRIGQGPQANIGMGDVVGVTTLIMQIPWILLAQGEEFVAVEYPVRKTNERSKIVLGL